MRAFRVFSEERRPAHPVLHEPSATDVAQSGCAGEPEHRRQFIGSRPPRSSIVKKPDIAETADVKNDPDKPARDPCDGASGIEEHQNMLSYILWLLSYFRSASEAAFTPMLKLQLFW